MSFDWGGLSTGRKVLLVGGILLLIDLSLTWQQVCVSITGFGRHCGGVSGWHGIGVLVGLLTIAMVLWEAIGAFKVDLGDALRNLPTALISVALAAAVAIFGFIEFLTHNEFRHWPAWIGLLLMIAIAVGGWLRFSEGGSSVRTPTTSSTPPPAPPE
jgi:hypothetical protein